jgi:hypothetical protein
MVTVALASDDRGKGAALSDEWIAHCRYCGAEVVRAVRFRDHEVTVLRRHLRSCQPKLEVTLGGVMSAVRRHFRVDLIEQPRYVSRADSSLHTMISG